MDKNILYKFFDGSASDEEVKQVRTWVEASAENKRELFKERKMFDAILLLAEPEKKQKYPLHRPPQRRIVKLRIPQIAAMLAIVFSLGLLSYPYIRQEGKPKLAWFETVAPLGAKSQVFLIDGTKVWLNAGSRLLYSTDFGQSNREVQLEGEGYFEVAKNTELPFEVKTSKLRIRAIGTAFNVKAYPGEETIETILVEGEVEVIRTSDDEQSDALIMKPKQRLTLLKNTDEILFEVKASQKEPTESSPVLAEKEVDQKLKYIESHKDLIVNTSWKDKRWRIESEELGSFAVKLERKYNVNIQFMDKDLPKYKFNGTFEEEPIEEVLRAVSLAAPVKFSIKGNNVSLFRNDKFKEAHQSLYEQPM